MKSAVLRFTSKCYRNPAWCNDGYIDLFVAVMSQLIMLFVGVMSQLLMLFSFWFAIASLLLTSFVIKHEVVAFTFSDVFNSTTVDVGCWLTVGFVYVYIHSCEYLNQTIYPISV